MTALVIVLSILGLFLLAQVVARVRRKIRRVPAPPILGRFLDSGFRRWWQPPERLIERSGIQQGMTVLELGCGSGAFTNSVARAVGEKGRLHALDMQLAMLSQLKHKLARPENRDITNIGVVQANAHGLPFKDGSFDLVFMVTVLPEIPDRDRALREVRRVLKPGGILAVTEVLPDPDFPLPSTTINECQRAGLVVDKKIGNLWNYTVRCRKPAD